jgi:chaperonin GroES
MQFSPMSDRIVVKQAPLIDKVGVILLPNPEEPLKGIIVACGPGKTKSNGKIQPLDVKVGDVIMYGQYANDKTLKDGDVTYIFMTEADVIGVVNE